MSNSKAAGTLTMGFNGKMSLALAKDIESHQKKEISAMTARGLVLDRLESDGWTPEDFASGTESREWIKQRITLALYNKAGLNRYLGKKADMKAEQWDQRDSEQAVVSSKLRDYKVSLEKRLVKAELIAQGVDPAEAVKQASEKSAAEKLATMLDSAKKLLLNPENELPKGFKTQQHISRLNDILADLGKTEPKH
tara:strand:+ start:217 stop:801 length:585 start_codon:yes stop_codon:yes gene_type:complete